MIKIVGYIGLYVKYTLFLSDVNEPELSQHIFKKILKTYNLMKIRQMGAEFFPRGQTGRR
jgi:hypothetical protein